MVEKNKYDKENNVLKRVKTIVTHHKQLTHAKGELFNIYTILNLKTNEVRTHSAFIAELLNPIGTHLMGNLFLKAFLKLLPEEVFNHLDTENATVHVEFYVGVVDILNKTGGRIDILLKDSSGKTISIENKIEAGDQEAQIERYCNFNKANNIVFYLTKYGDLPKISDIETFDDTGLYIISYQNHVIKWLERCQTIASDQPILRESIKQYKILIQQITNTLGNKQDEELEKIVVENLEEASVIATKYNEVLYKLKLSFRDKIIDLLKSNFTDYNIITKKDVNQSYASIWFENDHVNMKQVWFGIESFSGNGLLDGKLFIGIFDMNNSLKLNSQDYNGLTKNWVHHQTLIYKNEEINLSNSRLLQLIHSNEEEAIIIICNQIVDFINKNKHL